LRAPAALVGIVLQQRRQVPHVLLYLCVAEREVVLAELASRLQGKRGPTGVERA
jgi:hypothetical protein